MKRRAAIVLVGLSIAGAAMSPSTAAAAATAAVAVATVNMRAGPSTHYPIVVRLPPRAGMIVYGCTANTTWCDVSWGHERGWVAANYVQILYRGAPTLVTPAIVPAIGLAVVTFNQSYWNSYYVGRPWHGHWNRYHGVASRSVVAGCNGDRCGAAAVTRGPYGGGRVAIGGCGEHRCAGASVRRGPLGNTVVRHGSFVRN